MCKSLKEEGNTLFKEKEYQKAIDKYSRIEFFAKTIIADQKGGSFSEKLTEEENQEIRDIVAAGNLNMSICFFNLKDYLKSKEKASLSLEIKKTIKAYFRRASARA